MSASNCVVCFVTLMAKPTDDAETVACMTVGSLMTGVSLLCPTHDMIVLTAAARALVKADDRARAKTDDRAPRSEAEAIGRAIKEPLH